MRNAGIPFGIGIGMMLVGVLAGGALADGMIVPVRPDLRVRGSWAVKYHRVTMTVRNQVASVSIDQEFVNTGEGMIEVEYLFPVPPGAVIDSMTLLVNGQEFAARLLKADEARKIYEDIVRKKKDPALLEYAGFGLYRTRAFPLTPGTPARVMVTYKYVCKRDSDLIEVWYPLNTEKFSARPIEEVSVRADIKETSADITTIYSPSHDIAVTRKGPRHVIVTYKAANALPATDFQVFYKAANEDVGAMLLTYQPRGDIGYFMMLASPNPRTAKQTVQPKDVVVVLDRSGSMSGKKISQATEALRFIINNLNTDDHFNVIAYNDTVETFFPHLVPPGEDDVRKAMELIDGIDARGGTNIHEALQQAMGQAEMSHSIQSRIPQRPSYIIFLTDGLPTVGKTPEHVKESVIVADTTKANKIGARLFAFGVGYDVNVRLLDRLVAGNHGRSDYVKPNEPIESKVSSLYAKIKNPVMTDLKVRIHGVGMMDTYPREIGDLFEGDQIVLVGRYMEKDFASPPKTQLIITGNYEGAQRGFEYPVTLAEAGRSSHAFVETLWETRRVGWLLDQIQLTGEKDELVDEIVRLATAHGIMTPYTSFLADERTDLAAAPSVLRERAGKAIAADFEYAARGGASAQRSAMNRLALNLADRPAEKSASGPMQVIGYANKDAYEMGRAETVSNVRQAGNQAIYRRGRVWVAANASKLDPNSDENVKTIERFSGEYFELVRSNTIAENQVLATQQAGEELLIKLRGQAYRIKSLSE